MRKPPFLSGNDEGEPFRFIFLSGGDMYAVFDIFFSVQSFGVCRFRFKARIKKAGAVSSKVFRKKFDPSSRGRIIFENLGLTLRTASPFSSFARGNGAALRGME